MKCAIFNCYLNAITCNRISVYILFIVGQIGVISNAERPKKLRWLFMRQINKLTGTFADFIAYLMTYVVYTALHSIGVVCRDLNGNVTGDKQHLSN